MSEQTISTLEQSLITIINTVTQSVSSGVDFLSAQLPDVINQLLTWYFISNLIDFVMGILLVVIWISVGFKLMPKIVKSCKVSSDQVFVWGMYALLSIIPVSILPMFLNLEWIKIWIAPKLWLIEYAASLVK